MADTAREREGADRAEADQLDRILTELAREARSLARDALAAAGFHQHHRGEWRKRRARND